MDFSPRGNKNHTLRNEASTDYTLCIFVGKSTTRDTMVSFWDQIIKKRLRFTVYLAPGMSYKDLRGCKVSRVAKIFNVQPTCSCKKPRVATCGNVWFLVSPRGSRDYFQNVINFDPNASSAWKCDKLWKQAVNRVKFTSIKVSKCLLFSTFCLDSVIFQRDFKYLAKNCLKYDQKWKEKMSCQFLAENCSTCAF